MGGVRRRRKDGNVRWYLVPMATLRIVFSLSVITANLNSKTYFIILLLHSQSLRISLVIWLIDAFSGLAVRIDELFAHTGYHWATLFYHQHRMSHLPHIYEHAHKAHHFLHDSTAFDAHIYGSGAPEEFFSLWFEVYMACLLKWTPPSLAWRVLFLSWTNKIGHTRKEDGRGGVNTHTDHHTAHRLDFKIMMCEL